MSIFKFSAKTITILFVFTFLFTNNAYPLGPIKHPNTLRLPMQYAKDDVRKLVGTIAWIETNIEDSLKLSFLNTPDTLKELAIIYNGHRPSSPEDLLIKMQEQNIENINIDTAKLLYEVLMGSRVSRRTFLKNTAAVAISLVFTDVANLFAADTPEAKKSVAAMINWMHSNIVPSTGILKSFEIPTGQQAKVFNAIQGFFGGDTVEAATMAVIVRDGQVTYDADIGTLVGVFNNDPAMAQKQINTLWDNGVGMLRPICASSSQYYDYPAGLVSHEEGMRAWRLRLISAVGLWRSKHPFNSRMNFDWNDYHAIAGENFWNIILAMQLSFSKQGKGYHNGTTEFKLADELARFGFEVMQVKDGLAKGAFRMAPKGTHSPQDERLGRTGKKQRWYFDEVSTENNLSAFSAMRLMWEMTGDQKYKKAMEELKEYFKNAIVKDKETSGWYFDQGMHFNERTAKWGHNNKFATDCQTWAISMLGPEAIDEIFGEVENLLTD